MLLYMDLNLIDSKEPLYVARDFVAAGFSIKAPTKQQQRSKCLLLFS